MSIVPAARTRQFHYAIRNIVGAAEAREREGGRVVYLNIGDPQAYGFRPPAHVVEAAARAVRERFTGYEHSSGLREAREAVAAYATELGAQTAPGDVLMTAGASEAADLLLSALVEEGDEVLVPAPGYRSTRPSSTGSAPPRVTTRSQSRAAGCPLRKRSRL